LLAFYVWADDLNHRMARAVAEQFNAVGKVYEGGEEPMLGWDTVEPAQEGIKRVETAQKRVDEMIDRLATVKRSA
jgi:hypothetical protein